MIWALIMFQINMVSAGVVASGDKIISDSLQISSTTSSAPPPLSSPITTLQQVPSISGSDKNSSLAAIGTTIVDLSSNNSGNDTIKLITAIKEVMPPTCADFVVRTNVIDK